MKTPTLLVTAIAALVVIMAAMLKSTSARQRLGAAAAAQTQLLVVDNGGAIEAVPASDLIEAEMHELDALERVCARLERVHAHRAELARLRGAGTVYGLTDEARSFMFPNGIRVADSGHFRGDHFKTIPQGNHPVLASLTYDNHPSKSLNNTVASVQVPLHCSGEGYTHTNYKGAKEDIVPGIKYHDQMQRRDQWSSVRVRCKDVFLPKFESEASAREPMPAPSTAASKYVLGRGTDGNVERHFLPNVLAELHATLASLRDELRIAEDLRDSDVEDLKRAGKLHGLSKEAVEHGIFTPQVALFHDGYFQPRMQMKLKKGEYPNLETKHFMEHSDRTGKPTGIVHTGRVNSVKVPHSCTVKAYERTNFKGEESKLHAGNYTVRGHIRAPKSAKVLCIDDSDLVPLTF